MKKKAIVLILIFFNFSSLIFAQSIEMYWSKFAGKTYDFVIFQGDKPLTIQQDSIPKNGKFTLLIPQKYAPYRGMCRWLITGTQEGGGLDMAIDGKNFSIECHTDKPNTENIIFKEYNPLKGVNDLYAQQQIILDRFETMQKAIQVFDSISPLYIDFKKELKFQSKKFEEFHQKLKEDKSFIARFIPILNLSKGYATKLYDNEAEKASQFASFFANELDINELCRTGYWSTIISSWVQIHCFVLNDDKQFVEQFTTITKSINNKEIYTDFAGKVTYYLKQYGKDDKIEWIAPIITKYGKINEYVGVMEVYVKAMQGVKGADLIITEHIGKKEAHNHKTKVLQSEELASGSYKQSLLVFHQSGCGACEGAMQELKGVYATLKEKGVRVITISADKGELLYKNATQDFPWQDKYADFEGLEGINFKNYAVRGTPTMILLDKKGLILETAASINQLKQITLK